MDAMTRVGKRRIAVRRANYPTLWHFTSGEHGRKEAGIYAFWSAVLGARKLCGRALVTLPPGDRFDRIRGALRSGPAADRKAYAHHWNVLLRKGAAIRYIRPASPREVRRWMDAHPKDARFAQPMTIRKT